MSKPSLYEGYLHRITRRLHGFFFITRIVTVGSYGANVKPVDTAPLETQHDVGTLAEGGAGGEFIFDRTGSVNVERHRI